MTMKIKGVKRLKNGKYEVRVRRKNKRSTGHVDKKLTLPKGATKLDILTAREALQKKVIGLAEGIEHRKDSFKTLEDYADFWLSQQKERWAVHTYDRHNQAWTLHIKPVLGAYNLNRITRQDLVDWVHHADKKKYEGQQYSVRSVLSWRRTLLEMLRHAHRSEYLQKDLTTGLPKPHKRNGGKNRERETINQQQLMDVLKEIQNFKPSEYGVCTFLALTGCRISEAISLTWDCVDLQQGVVYIQKSCAKGEIKSTKNNQYREIPINDTLKAVLQECNKTKNLTFEGFPHIRSKLVFPSTKTGKFKSQSLIRDTLIAAAQRIGLEINLGPQVLRRSLNTILCTEGVPLSTVQAIIGHNSAQMTHLYTNVPHEQKLKALSTLSFTEGAAP